MKQITQLKYLLAYYAYHHCEPQEFDDCGGMAQFLDDAANAIQDAMPTADIETIRPFLISGRVNEWIPLGQAIESVLVPAEYEDDEYREPTEEEVAKQQAEFEAEFSMICYTIELGHYVAVDEVYDSFEEAERKAKQLKLPTYEIKEQRYRWPNYKKGDRVRTHSAALGHFYGTVVQDAQISGGRFVLIHFDGNRPFDHRWTHARHIYREDYPGQYAIERVSDPRLTLELT